MGISGLWTYKGTLRKFQNFIPVDCLKGDNTDIKISGKYYTKLYNLKIDLTPKTSDTNLQKSIINSAKVFKFQVETKKTQILFFGK